MIKIICAVSKNGVIGRNNDLIFKDKQDLQHFKETTSGHCVVMGRKTWESIGSKPLSNRKNLVLTRAEETSQILENGGIVTDEILYITTKSLWQNDDLFVIGGGEVYRQTIDYADELIISEFPKFVSGNKFFPYINLDIWEVKEERPFTNFTLKTYKRREV